MKPTFLHSIVILFVINIIGITNWGQDLNPIVLGMYGLTPVNEKDAHWSIIHKEIERMIKSDPNSLTGLKIEKYGAINTKDANSLFPGWKFYGFDYSMYVKNPEDVNKVSIPLDWKNTLGVFSDSNSIKTSLFNHYGNHEELADFFKMNKICILDSTDAKLVWGAFCEINRGGSKTAKFEKVSDNEWKFGNYSYEQTIASNTTVKRTHFYKVTTDQETKQITDQKGITETTDIEQQVQNITVSTGPWIITFEPSGYASAQYGSTPGDSGYVPKGTVDFISLLKSIESTPTKEKKEPSYEFQIAILHKGQNFTTAFTLTDVSFIRDVLLSLESKWKQMPLGTRFNELHNKYPIIEKQ